MFFWNVEDLKHALRTTRSERHSFHYLMALVVGPMLVDLAITAPTLLALLAIGSLEEPVAIDSETQQSTIEFVSQSLIATFAIAVVVTAGLRFCYRKNGGANGEQFLDRTLALTWVCGIRVNVMLVAPLFVGWVIIVAFVVRFEEPSGWSVYLALALYPIMVGVTLWRVGVHLGDLAKRAA